MDLMTNTNFKRKLPVPQEIKKEMPLTKEAEEIKAKRDEEIAKVFKGESDKFLLVIGPCSAGRNAMLFLTIFPALQWFKPTLRTRF